MGWARTREGVEAWSGRGTATSSCAGVVLVGDSGAFLSSFMFDVAFVPGPEPLIPSPILRNAARCVLSRVLGLVLGGRSCIRVIPSAVYSCEFCTCVLACILTWLASHTCFPCLSETRFSSTFPLDEFPLCGDVGFVLAVSISVTRLRCLLL